MIAFGSKCQKHLSITRLHEFERRLNLSVILAGKCIECPLIADTGHDRCLSRIDPLDTSKPRFRRSLEGSSDNVKARLLAK